MRSTAWLALFLLCGACRTGGAAAREKIAEPSIEPLEGRFDGRFGLLLLYPAYGSWPVPANFAQAEALYADGCAAYEADAFAKAAEIFVRAAKTLKLDAGAHYADTASANRSILYQNAAIAWVMAGTPEEGKAVLGRLQKDGSASAEDLREALRFLDGAR